MRRLLLILICCALFTGCYYDVGFISVRRDVIDVGRVAVGDSAHATFRFRNSTPERVSVTFMPECDCTTVSADSIVLGPRESAKLKVKVAVDTPGEFIKYVYVQAPGDSDFFTIAVMGTGKYGMAR